MKFRTISGLTLVMIFLSCAQRATIKESSNVQQEKFKSGLTIENRTNRGTSFTDSLGNDFNIRNIPVAITNDTTVSISVQIAFSMEYSYPYPDSNEKFKLIPLSKQWALDGLGVTESMIGKLPFYINRPVVNKIIKPGEKLVLSIGSVYPNPARVSGVLPRTLFVQGDLVDFPECEWLMEKDRLSNQQIPLGLKVRIGEYCMIIPCGSMAYLKD